MKTLLRYLLLLPLLLSAWRGQAQTYVELQKESFEVLITDASSQVDVANTLQLTTATSGNNDSYYRRTSNATIATDAPGFSGSSSAPVVLPSGGALDGSFYWAGEAVKGTGGTPSTAVRNGGKVTLKPVNIAGYASLQVKLAIMLGRSTRAYDRMEQDDTLRVQVRYNGAGAWETVGQLMGDNSASAGAGNWRIDSNFNNQSADDVALGSQVVTANPMVDFTFSVNGTGSTMQTRVVVATQGASEEFAFDNIRVMGVLSNNLTPSLTIDPTALTYTEGDPATVVAPTLTVSDGNDANLISAQVSISQNFDTSEDRLLFTNQNGIAGLYNTGTGVLSLSGSSSKANYEAALRSVRYQNIDVLDPLGLARKVRFTVTDPAGATSTGVERTINVVPTLALVGMPYLEDLTTDGEGNRYTSTYFTQTQSGTSAAFTRTSTNPNTQNTPAAQQTTFGNISNSWYWYSNVTGNNSFRQPFYIGSFQTQPINTAGYANLSFNLRLGARAGAFDVSDYIKIYYRSNEGAWVLLGQFRGSSSADADMKQDLNVASIGATPTGPSLTPSLASFPFGLPASVNGTKLDFKIETYSNVADEQIAFDLLQLTGTLVVAPTVATAAATTITGTSALLGGNVTADGGATVSERGVVYSTTNTTPTTSNTKVQIGSGTGTFSQALTGLTPGTTYYVRAYAINTAGTGYGTVQPFTTTPNAPVVVSPPNGSTTNANTPTYLGTATANSTVTVYVRPSGGSFASIGTTTTSASGSWTLTQPTALPDGSTAVYATATIGTSAVSANSNTNTFTIDTTVPTATIVRQTPSATTTNATSLVFRVTFNESVFGVSASSFVLNTTGTTGTIASATVVTGSTVYDVTVNTVSGNGTLGLNLKGSGSGVADNAGNVPAGVTGPVYTIDQTVPTVAISSSAGATGSTTTTSPIPFTVTFSENVTGFVAGDITVTNGSITGGVVNGVSPGTTYTFTVTPNTPGTASTVTVPAAVAQDAAGNANTAAPSSFSITYNLPNATVTSVTRLTPSPTATASVQYQVVFSASVTGFSAANLTVTPTGTLSGLSVIGVSGAGTTYTVVLGTGTGEGTLRLNVQNSTGISPTVTNVPYTSGETYSIVKSFPVAPLLTVRGAGSASGNYTDVTAFVDLLQVVQNGTNTTVANGLQNGSFESNNVLAAAGSFLYAPSAVASAWTLGTQTGVSRNGTTNFSSTAADGTAVAFLQNGGPNSSVAQNLAVPTGSYQVTFGTRQRSNNGPSDQVLNVFLNDGANNVFIGTIQPTSYSTYQYFTSAAFSVTAPPLTAIVSTTSASPTSTSPIPFSVSFSQSVGTSFTDTDVTVSNGSVTTSSFSGSGSGPYTFTVTPTGNGTVTVSLAAGVANDANNTGNLASNSVSVQYNQPVTPAPVVTIPSNGATTNSNPTSVGSAVVGSTVRVYIDGVQVGTDITPNSGGTWIRTFSGTPLTRGTHTVYATAQLPGQQVSAPSPTNTFTVQVPATYTSGTADQPNISRVPAGSTNQEILRVAIVIDGGPDAPLSATSFSFDTPGSSAPSVDIDAARVYYTGTSGTFAATTQFGSTLNSPSGPFTITGNQQLSTGTNYFFLVYDVDANATSGNLLDATMTSLTVGGTARTPSVTDPAGNRQIVNTSRVAGTALRFTGNATAGYVDFSASPTQAPLLNGSYTQAVWIKPAIGTSSTNYYVLGNGTGNSAAPYIYVSGNGRIGAGFGTGSATVNQQTSPNNIPANAWHHVVATYNGSVLLVYLNGELVINASASGTPASTRVNFVGNVAASGSSNFPGDIDEVSQWSRALSQTEVRLLRHLTLDGLETGLVSYLQFNDSGTTTTDGISGAVGTLTGATRVTSTAPVGYGTSFLRSVTAMGNYNFTGTNAAINFTSVSGAPYEVVVTRLEGSPLGTQVIDPAIRSRHARAYWIVDKYSTSNFAATVTYTLDPGLISAGDAAAPSNLKVYKRDSNSDGTFESPISATAANTTASTVTFPVTSFGQNFIATYGSSPLPVELIRFTAERRNNDALLQWATAQELNNDYFEVESSVDGRTFRAIGRVAGHGTSSQPHAYQLIDVNLARYARSVVFYRLRQVDQDGTSTLSSVQTVLVPNEASSLTAVVFPNPAADQLTVRLSRPYTGKAQGWLFDTQGRTVQELNPPLATSPDINLSVAYLPNGVYTLRLVLDGQVIHQQIVVQR
ncbi:LamG-like jellyroll fold domain-containing protein [Hymenobacter sediminicola]|uniref:T9SS type A sorting domain-containing protein n=1 Tax=Hymenobacter sediminicola TaxID=2761579 RepID=A0A7G7W9N4_9BACT|nr:LamG-like jellyroll fold domain-containing protein [Hymenobacter sediminicola]QNH63077.1 T9SS type A sorting domain-containing protein [Hymenobacter sediminicola]